MKAGFRALIYGTDRECRDVGNLLRVHPAFANTALECRNAENFDSLHMNLVDWAPDLTIVAQDGAAGMEGVYLVNRHSPQTPVIWFSDDQNFGMQSHRLECVYFAVKPITQAKMTRALQRCDDMGIRLHR